LKTGTTIFYCDWQGIQSMVGTKKICHPIWPPWVIIVSYYLILKQTAQTTHTDAIMAKVIKDSSIDNPHKNKFHIYFQSDIHFATLPKTAGTKDNTRNIQT